jgi:hypothetical protein
MATTKTPAATTTEAENDDASSSSGGSLGVGVPALAGLRAGGPAEAGTPTEEEPAPKTPAAATSEPEEESAPKTRAAATTEAEPDVESLTEIQAAVRLSGSNADVRDWLAANASDQHARLYSMFDVTSPERLRCAMTAPPVDAPRDLPPGGHGGRDEATTGRVQLSDEDHEASRAAYRRIITDFEAHLNKSAEIETLGPPPDS